MLKKISIHFFFLSKIYRRKTNASSMDFSHELKKYPFFQPPEEITTFYKALETLVQHPDMCVKYAAETTFYLDKIDVQETLTGQAFFDVRLKRDDMDVICNVRCTEPIVATIGDKGLDVSSSDYILMCVSTYSPVNVRIFVDRDNPTVSLTYDAILLPNAFRDRICNAPFITCGNAYYKNGEYEIEKLQES